MERQFKGVWIPSAVWLNTELTAIEKMLFAEIDSFSSRGSTFFKSNDTLSVEMGVSSSTIKRSLANLNRLGFIRHIKYDGRVRHLQSCDLSDGSNKTTQKDQIDLSDGSKPTHQKAHKEPLSKHKKVTRQKPNRIEVPIEFQDELFLEAWETWKQYKAKEHNFKYKSEISQQTTIQKLYNDTQGNPEIAIRAIGNAIARGWKGIYPQPSDASQRDTSIDTASASKWAMQ